MLLFSLSTKAASAQVVINEVLPDPAGADKDLEWIELFNTTDETLVLDDYILEDRNGKRITLSGTITKWLVIYPHGQGGFAIANSGETTLKLYNSPTSTQPVDFFTYTDSSEDKSWGRIPDGGSIFADKLVTSPGSANQMPSTPTPAPNSTPEPTITPTTVAVPTSTPIPTKTPSPTPKPTIKATLKLTMTPLPSESPGVLGIAAKAPAKSPEVMVAAETESKVPVIAYGLIGLGGLSIGGAFYPFLKEKIKGYNNSHDQVA